MLIPSPWVLLALFTFSLCVLHVPKVKAVGVSLEYQKLIATVLRLFLKFALVVLWMDWCSGYLPRLLEESRLFQKTILAYETVTTIFLQHMLVYLIVWSSQ